MAVLQTHYRSTMELGESSLAGAAEAARRLETFIRRSARAGLDTSAEPEAAVMAAFRKAMDDDMATPSAMDTIFGAVRKANMALDEGRNQDASRLTSAVVELVAVLGLEITQAAHNGGDDNEIALLVARRDEARASKDFGLADQLRDDLEARGIKLEDTATGTAWHRG